MWICTGIGEECEMEVRTAISADSICREDLRGREHPERPERFDAIVDALRQAERFDSLGRLGPRAATEDELALCHTREYLSIARKDVEAGRPYLSTGDTDVGPNSWEVALRAAGAGLNAVDAVVGGHARNAFCVVRPPGHHANAVRG